MNMTSLNKIISHDDIDSLWNACAVTRSPRLCKIAILLYYTYGLRTSDLLVLRKQDFDVKARVLTLIRSGKLYCWLPLTNVAIAQLRATLEAMDDHELLFRDLPLRRFMSTWRNEILPAAGMQGLKSSTFRQSVLIRYNAIQYGLGNAMLGHFVERPSPAQMCALIESVPVPDCFHDLS